MNAAQKSAKFNCKRTSSGIPKDQLMYVSSVSRSLQQLLLHLSCDTLSLPMHYPGCSLLPSWGASTNYTLYTEPQEQEKL